MKTLKIALCVLMALCLVFAALSCSQEKTDEKTDGKKTEETVKTGEKNTDAVTDENPVQTGGKPSSGDTLDVITAAVEKTFSGGAEYEMSVKMAGMDFMSSHVATDGKLSRTESTAMGISGVTYSDGEWNYSEALGMKSKTKVSDSQSTELFDVDLGSVEDLFNDGEVKNAVSDLVAKGTVTDTAGGKLYTVNYNKGDLDAVAAKLGDLAETLNSVDTAKIEILVKSGYIVSMNLDMSAEEGGESQNVSVVLNVINPGTVPTVTLPDDLDEYEDYSGGIDFNDEDWDVDDDSEESAAEAAVFAEVAAKLFDENGARVEDFESQYAELVGKYGVEKVDGYIFFFESLLPLREG